LLFIVLHRVGVVCYKPALDFNRVEPLSTLVLQSAKPSMNQRRSSAVKGSIFHAVFVLTLRIEGTRGKQMQTNANPTRVVTFVTSVRLAQKNCLAEPASLTSHSKSAVIEGLLDEPFLFNSEPFTVTTMDPSMTTHSFACKRYCL
jgi:hypothetical protein